MIGLPQRFCETKDLWEKVEEPKRVRWTKQRGDESAAVEKLSKRFTQIFRAPQTEEQVEKPLLFCKTKEQYQKALLKGDRAPKKILQGKRFLGKGVASVKAKRSLKNDLLHISLCDDVVRPTGFYALRALSRRGSKRPFRRSFGCKFLLQIYSSA